MTAIAERVLFHTGSAELVLPDGVDREPWLAARRTGLGGSDIAGLLGMSRWSSPYQVWLDKTGRTAEEDDTWPMFRGREDETKLRRWFTRQTGIEVKATGMWRSIAHPLAFANPDGLTADDGLLECKSHSWRMGEEWDEEQVSDAAELQTQWYLGVLDLSHAWVIAQIGDDEPVIRRVERDRLLFDHLVRTADRFWRDHVVNDLAPALASVDLDVVKDRYRTVEVAGVEAKDPGTIRALLAERAEGKARESAGAAQAAAAEAQLREHLGHAEAITVAGTPLLTARPNGTFASSRFAAAHPDVAAECTTQQPVLDVDLLKTKHPDLYTAFRARVLRPVATKEK
jgi:putative phage-type endonuclease